MQKASKGSWGHRSKSALTKSVTHPYSSAISPLSTQH
uniref:Uncharacterized protein n=1 Tax=Arundo donax TaxID=35708 RepID=A0A0A9ADM3_ARUDO